MTPCNLCLQAAIVRRLYRSMDEVAGGTRDPKGLTAIFEKNVRIAAKIGALESWPFPLSSDEDNVLTSTSSIVSVLQKAHHTQRTPQLLPMLENLFAAMPARNPGQCCELLDCLHALADIKLSHATCFSCNDHLTTMLAVWLQPVQQAVAYETSSTIAVDSHADTESKQQQPPVNVPSHESALDEALHAQEVAPLAGQVTITVALLSGRMCLHWVIRTCPVASCA